MNKAFTLAELMGVIIILGIIATVVTVTVDRNIKKGRVTTCQAQEKTIIEAAKTWSIDNPKDLPNDTNPTKEIKIEEDLQAKGYLDAEFKNPMTNDDYSSNTKVEISITKNETTGNYNSDYTYKINYGDDDKGCS